MAKRKRRGRGQSTASAPSSDGGSWIDDRAGDGERAIRFVEENLCHWEGEWAGKPFLLMPWEKEIVRDIFGWKRPDGLRRYRTVYVEVPKGNGKSPLAAAIACLLLFWDAEAGAQVYSVAGDQEQARIVFSDAANMVDQSDELASASITLKDRIVYPAVHGFYQVLSSKAPTKHGLRPHGILFDELHVQPNRILFDTLRFAMKKRRQPLFVMITTAGLFDEDSLCWTEHQYAAAVISGDIVDDGYYAVIYGATAEDDWTSDATFAKANPSLGVTVRLDDLREECNRALKNPADQPGFCIHRSLCAASISELLPRRRVVSQYTLRLTFFAASVCIFKYFCVFRLR